MYVCMYVCMHTCMHTCMYACMYVSIYLSIYLCMHTCMYVSMYVCIHVCVYVCMYVCILVSVCMRACMFVCMYVCLYVFSNVNLECWVKYMVELAAFGTCTYLDTACHQAPALGRRTWGSYSDREVLLWADRYENSLLYPRRYTARPLR